MSVVHPSRRAWTARGARVGALAATLAVLGACADSITPTSPVGGANASVATSATPNASVPDVVRRVHLNMTGRPYGGYIVTSLTLGDTAYAVAFDTTGKVAWYRAFPGYSGSSDAYLQPNGDMTLGLGASRGWEPVPGFHQEFRPATGAPVKQWAAPSGYYTDLHEIRVGSGSKPTYLFGYDIKPMDLRPRGGADNTPTAGHTIFSVDASGNAKPVFVSRDHFTTADWINPETLIQDYDHPNSIDVDTDGGLIVSWRNFDEVSKIDPNTGQFVWRLGGRHSQFTFVNDPFNGFSGQHFARVLANGNVLLYDDGNAHAPKESRAAEYKLDPVAHTATLVWQYRHSPAIYTPFVGSAQRLPNGNTVVGFGNVGVVTEVTSSGSVVWEGTLSVDGKTGVLAYRLLKYTSLGHFQP
ncbi:hypothetical protein tb265_00800 [Gemmatimonadetes bacterium T265]|nr:hypothetical protein tb265_00800 [Gemmatimonadetes bacterium T265]